MGRVTHNCKPKQGIRFGGVRITVLSTDRRRVRLLIETPDGMPLAEWLSAAETAKPSGAARETPTAHRRFIPEPPKEPPVPPIAGTMADHLRDRDKKAG